MGVSLGGGGRWGEVVGEGGLMGGGTLCVSLPEAGNLYVLTAWFSSVLFFFLKGAEESMYSHS